MSSRERQFFGGAGVKGPSVVALIAVGIVGIFLLAVGLNWILSFR